MKYHIAYPVGMRPIFRQVQCQAPRAKIWIGNITAAQQPLMVWLYPDNHCMKIAYILDMYTFIGHLCSGMGDVTLLRNVGNTTDMQNIIVRMKSYRQHPMHCIDG